MMGEKNEGIVLQSRNTAIDILKVFAVLLVMNSHMGICYPKYGFMSTGGAIGDALFFFASGFTLFMGRSMRFDNWYKRRINRIYPSIIAAAIVAWAIWGSKDTIGDVLLGKRYWFVGCILIYYIFLYPIKTFIKTEHVRFIFLFWGFCLVLIYFFFFNNGQPFYGGGLFRCLAYFLIMLQGAMMGIKQNEYVFKYKHLIVLVTLVFLWYALFYLGKDNWMILLSFVVLMGITRYFYILCNAVFFNKLYKTQILGSGLFIISQLCLEVYLIQKFVFTDKWNYLFPLNIPLIMIQVIVVAYFVKTLSEFISQTFRTEPYEWGKLLLRR